MLQTFSVGNLKITFDQDDAQRIKAVEVDLSPAVVPKYTNITHIVLHSPKAVNMINTLIDEYSMYTQMALYSNHHFLTHKIAYHGTQVNS